MLTFLDVYFALNRFVRLRKSLFRETYLIKEFTFDPHFAYQSCKLTAELHLSRKEILFILENLKLFKKSYNKISKTRFIPYLTPNFVKTPQLLISPSFGIRFPEICFEKLINFVLSSQIYIKKKLDYLLKK